MQTPHQVDCAGLRIVATFDNPGRITLSAFELTNSDGAKSHLWRLDLDISRGDRDLDQVWAVLLPLTDTILIQACAEHYRGASKHNHGLWMFSLTGELLWHQPWVCAEHFAVEDDILWVIDLIKEGFVDPSVRLRYCVRALNLYTGQPTRPARRLKMPMDFDFPHHWHWSRCIVKRAITNHLAVWIHAYRDFCLQTGRPLCTPEARSLPDDWTDRLHGPGILPNCTFQSENGIICARMSMIFEYAPPLGTTTMAAKNRLPGDLVVW